MLVSSINLFYKKRLKSEINSFCIWTSETADFLEIPSKFENGAVPCAYAIK
jgi:hypothetical protein